MNQVLHLPQKQIKYYIKLARVAELADALDLGSSGATHGGSTPPPRIALFFERELKGAKSGIAMGKSNPSGWPTRAGVGGEGANSPPSHNTLLRRGVEKGFGGKVAFPRACYGGRTTSGRGARAPLLR